MTVHDMTGNRCRVSGLRNGRPESERVIVEWTLDMARAAGLVNKSNWRSYPRAMLLARATSDLMRLLFPDVIKGLGYIAETDASVAELEAWAPDTGTDVPVAPERRRKPPQRRTPPRLPSPGHHLATEDSPGPDGSVDVELPAWVEPPAPATVELPPELPPTDSEPEAPPKLIGDAPRNAINAKLGQILGRGTDRADRLGALAAIAGRHELLSSSDLTRQEGYAVLGVLDRINAGLAGVRMHDNGSWVLESYEAPPPADDDPWAHELPGMPDEPPNSGRDRA